MVALISPTRIMTKCLRPISRRRGSGWRISPALCWCRDHSPRQWKRSAPMCSLIVVRRSEEHTSELQSLMRISYAVFCLKKKKNINIKQERENGMQMENEQDNKQNRT